MEDDGQHSTALRTSAAGEEEDGVACQTTSLTYRELEEHTDALARVLVHQHGVQVGDRVAVATHRCIAMVVGVIAIMKAGAAFVAIDPAHPSERKAMIMEDCGATIIVTMPGILDDFLLPRGSTGLQLRPDGTPSQQHPRSQHHSEPTFLPRVNSDDLCYSYYTSGSTGKPKGVIVEHRNVINQLWHFQRHYNLQRGSTVMAVTTLTFDPCIMEIFWPLSFGARVVIASTATQRRPDIFLKLLQHAEPDILQATPTMFHMMASMGWEGSPATHILCGGEAFPTALKPIMQRCKSFSNVYGPTETTVWATHMRVDTVEEWDRLGSEMPAGRGLDNYVTLVLDNSMKEVGQGETGELYLGGAGMTRGYHNRPELNSQAFVESPFRAVTDPTYEHKAPRANLIYRTGDLFSWTKAGLLSYVGRVDSQVKVNGHRMEMGEIEKTLESQSDVQRAITLARDDLPGFENTKVLVAYVQLTTRSGSENRVHDELPEARVKLVGYLKAKLPHYMVPKHIVFMEEWPMNTSNKVMRQALPMPEQAPVRPCLLSSDALESPGQAIDKEEIVHEIQECVVQATGQPVDRQASLMAVGIDSVLVVVFTRALSSKFGIVMTGKDLMRHSTIDALATLVQHKLLEARGAIKELTPDAKLMSMVENLVGLRGLAALFVFIYHENGRFTQFPNTQYGVAGYAFIRPLDIQTFFVLIGVTTFLQNQTKPASFFAFWSSNFKKLFPIYWLAIAVVYVLQNCIYGRYTAAWKMDLSTSCWLQNLFAVQSWDFECGWGVSLVHWFVSALWQIMLFAPLLVHASKKAAGVTSKLSLLVGLVIANVVVHAIFTTSADGEEIVPKDPWYQPWVQVWPFLVGLGLGTLMVSDVDPALEVGLPSWLYRHWGPTTDILAVALAIVSFSPEVTADEVGYVNPRSTYGYITSGGMYPYYPTTYDKWIVMPLQFVLHPAFIFALSHGKGYVSTALRWAPFTFLGTYVWAFYLLHWPICEMCYVTWTLYGGGMYTDGGPFGSDATATSGSTGKLALWGVPALLLTCLVSWWVTEYFQPAVISAMDCIVNLGINTNGVAHIVNLICGEHETTTEINSDGSESTPLLHKLDSRRTRIGQVCIGVRKEEEEVTV